MSIIGNLVKMYDGMDESKNSMNFDDLQPVRDYKSELRRGNLAPVTEKVISEDVEFPYKAFYGSMSKSIVGESVVEGMSRAKPVKPLFDMPEPSKPVPVEAPSNIKIRANDIILDPIEEERLNEMKKELSEDMKSTTLFDYVKLAYIAKRGLHNSTEI